MSRGSLRGFATGLLFATILIGGLYYIEESEQKSLTLEELKAESEKRGYVLMKEENKEVTNNQKEPSQADEPSVSYTLEVTEGMNSEDIADLLQRNGIIEDARDFQVYLEDNKLTKSIQIDSYIMTNEMTFDLIAQAITKRTDT